MKDALLKKNGNFIKGLSSKTSGTLTRWARGQLHDSPGQFVRGTAGEGGAPYLCLPGGQGREGMEK